MKKILISLIIFLISPVIVLADNYKVSHYYIDANILENGDIAIEELIVLKGTFNSYEKNLFYKKENGKIYDASDITDISVMGKEINGEVSFDTFKTRFNLFEKVREASDGTRQKYIEKSSENGIKLNIFYRTNNSKTAFLIKYKLKNVGISHADAIEVFWNFLDSEYTQDLNDVNIRIKIPKNIKKDDIKWWFHGKLAENSHLEETGSYLSIVSHTDKLENDNSIEFRLLLPKEYFEASRFLKMDNENVVDKIVMLEDEKEATILEIINKDKLTNNIIIYATFIYLGILIITWLLIFIIFDKRRKVKFKRKYNQKFIESYNVEDIEYLLDKKVTLKAFLASILNLVYKKNILYERFLNKKKESERLILISKEKLNEAELKLIDILFYDIGNNKTLVIDDFNKYLKNENNQTKFLNNYKEWQLLVEKDCQKQKFFLPNKKYKILAIIFSILALLITFCSIFLKVHFILSKIVIIPALIFVIYLICMGNKSEKGLEHLAKWKAFRNFLIDFGAFAKKDLPAVDTWEKYLVYAQVFGLYNSVIANMNLQLKEMHFSKATLTKHSNKLNKNFIVELNEIIMNKFKRI